MRGRVEISICGKDAKVVEVIRRSTVVSNGVLKLPEIVERGDLFQVDLESVRCVRTCVRALEG